MSDAERLISAVLPASRQFDRAERLTYREAMQLHAGVDVFQDATPILVARLQSAGIEVPRDVAHDRDACLDLIMGTLVGPQLGLDRLTFIYDYPASQAALARVHGHLASRFEAYLDGIELCNGFHELGDPQEQRARFEHDVAERRRRGLAAVPIDENFLAALEHGLPECSGVALGFDRLLMLGGRRPALGQELPLPVRRTA